MESCFVVAIVLLLTTVVGAVDRSLYVKSDQSNACFANWTCKSLAYYIRYQGTYFVNDTRVVFLEGTHRLSGVLNVTGVHNLSLSSYLPLRAADVRCEGHSGLIFSMSANIIITNVNFSSCGTNISHLRELADFAALSYIGVAAITLDKVTVVNSTGFGVYASRVCDQVYVKQSEFSHNKGNRYAGGNARFFFSNCSANSNNSLIVYSSHFLNGFTDRNDASGLTVLSASPGMLIHLDSVTASDNHGGNVRLIMKDFIGHQWDILVNNSMINGGNEGSGLYLESDCNHTAPNNKSTGNSMRILETQFVSNTAEKRTVGLMVSFHCMPCNIRLVGCVFDGNVVTEADRHGAAVKIQVPHPVPRLNGCQYPLYQVSIIRSHFCNNMIQGSHASVVELWNIEKASIEDCSFSDNVGTAIALTSSSVIFTGDVLFANNTATNGGALRFCDSSVMFLNIKTRLSFLGNSASQTGGAIFVQEADMDQLKACFFQPVVKENSLVADLSTKNEIELCFTNNTAEIAGDAIFGGDIDNCYTYTKFKNNSGSTSSLFSSEVFNETSNGLNYSNTTVSSEPYKLIFCGGSEYLDSAHPISVIPGKTFYVGVVVVGQRFGIAPAIVTAELAGHDQNSSITQTYHSLTTPARKCALLTFKLKTTQTIVEIVLNVQRGTSQSQNFDSNEYKKYVNAKVHPCPWGFEMDTVEGMCKCLEQLHTICDLETSTINLTPRNFKWLGCENSSNESGCIDRELMVAYRCGNQDHCNIFIGSITATRASEICADGRTGILCGSCVAELSIVLGTGRCKSCPASNVYLSLVVVFLGSGILLIIILTTFRLTVNYGTLNGLLFYANFMHWNRGVFFPHFQNADVLRLLISWLSLDMGFEVCFFNGMTALHVIWLEIGYILYLVFLQVAIIVLCRRYIIFTRFFGRHVTKVMSTLVILLYAKTLSTIASIFTFVHVHNTVRIDKYKVLGVDGNVRFGSPEHIPLLVVGLFLALFLFLFMFSLVFIQILTKISSQRCFKWVARFQPFFRTITGPCNSNYAFWPGYLLFVRTAYFLSRPFDRHLDSALLISGCAIVTIIFSFLGPKGVYKKWSMNILELSLLLNLTITSLVLIGHKTATAFGRVSVALALLVFVTYHISSSTYLKRPKEVTVSCISHCKAFLARGRVNKKQRSQPTVSQVTVSTCGPAERTPLLTAQVMPPVINYGKLREPLIED